MTETFVEPFGVVFDSKGEGTGGFTPAYVKLPEGVHTIMITWDGNEQIRIHRSPDQIASQRVEIGQVPGWVNGRDDRRSLVITGLGVKAGESAWLSITTYSTEVAGKRATMQVTTLPLQ